MPTVRSSNKRRTLAMFFAIITILPLCSAQAAVLLQFKITKDQLPVAVVSDSNVTLSFLRDGNNNDRLYISNSELSGAEGQYSAQFQLPFAGEYVVNVHAETESAGTIYLGDAEFYFTADEDPGTVTLTSKLSRDLVKPEETIVASAIVKFNEQPMPNVTVKADLKGGATTTLLWDNVHKYYKANINSPAQEGCSEIRVYIEEDPSIGKEENTHMLYTVDTDIAGVQLCPAQCTTMDHVRSCAREQKNGNKDRDEIQACLEQFCVSPPAVCCGTPCEMADLDGSGEIDDQDVTLLEQIVGLPSQQRTDYLVCADVNDDSDVTEDDVECVLKVIAGDWQEWHCSDIWCIENMTGDLNADENIDEEDVSFAYEIAAMNKQDRLGYVMCADVSGDDGEPDGDVTERDAQCISAVANGTIDPWECKLFVEGGVIPKIRCGACAGDTDNEGGRNLEDLKKLKWIIGEYKFEDVLVSGKEFESKALPCTDFDMNGKLDSADAECWQTIFGGEVENGSETNATSDGEDEESSDGKVATVLGNTGKIPAQCIKIYGTLSCAAQAGGSSASTRVEGDVNNDGMLSCNDADIICMYANNRTVKKAGMEKCADINSDQAVTQLDCTCVTQFAETGSMDAQLCAKCQGSEASILLYGTAKEICNNGIDDDCDSLIDVVYANASDPEGGNLCDCTPKTPCGMVWDDSQGVADLTKKESAKFIKFCRQTPGDVKPRWMGADEWQCTESLFESFQTTDNDCSDNGVPPPTKYGSRCFDDKNLYVCENGREFKCLFDFRDSLASSISSRAEFLWAEVAEKGPPYRPGGPNGGGIGANYKVYDDDKCPDNWRRTYIEGWGYSWSNSCRHEFDCCDYPWCNEDYEKSPIKYPQRPEGKYYEWPGKTKFFSAAETSTWDKVIPGGGA